MTNYSATTGYWAQGCQIDDLLISVKARSVCTLGSGGRVGVGMWGGGGGGGVVVGVGVINIMYIMPIKMKSHEIDGLINHLQPDGCSTACQDQQQKNI